MSKFTEKERAYINHLNEVTGNPDYGLLLYKGDPIAFQVGMRDWESERPCQCGSSYPWSTCPEASQYCG